MSDRTAENGDALAMHGTGEEFIRGLYDEHGSRLTRYAARLLGGDWHQAEDVLQEAVTRAWKHANAIDGDAGEARPWLFTTVRRLVVDHHRARRVRPAENRLPHVPDAADALLSASASVRVPASVWR
ncbi:sigma factor [Streptomyces sporangiiformans]|uniref:sigma factor n=1 Tax=Streptomyces sporangiiformans TaxID=2315329 RepID=UPI001F089D8F|nr:sigma factor [Streptomyces sporangiiformans]